MKKSSQEMVLGSALNFSEHFYERPVGGGCINLGFHDDSKWRIYPANIYFFKSTIETLEKDVKYVQS